MKIQTEEKRIQKGRGGKKKTEKGKEKKKPYKCFSILHVLDVGKKNDEEKTNNYQTKHLL